MQTTQIIKIRIKSPFKDISPVFRLDFLLKFYSVINFCSEQINNPINIGLKNDK